MAFVSLWDEQQDKNKGLGQPGQPVTGGGSALAPMSASQGEAKKTNSGTGWTNLQNYIAANQGAGDQMGQKVADDFKPISASADKEVSDTNSAIQKGVQNGPDIDIWNPQAVNQDQFNAWRNPTYAGPAAFAPTNAANVKAWGDNSQSFEGRKNILRDSYKRDDYNGGMQNLDSLLLGGSQSAVNQLSGIRDYATNYDKSVKDTQGAIGTAQKNASDLREQRGAITDGTRQNMRDDLAYWTSKAGGTLDAGPNGTDFLTDAQRNAYDKGREERAKLAALEQLIGGYNG